MEIDSQLSFLSRRTDKRTVRNVVWYNNSAILFRRDPLAWFLARNNFSGRNYYIHHTPTGTSVWYGIVPVPYHTILTIPYTYIGTIYTP